MRGQIEVVDHCPQVSVVKSVKEVGRLINLAAIPTPKLPKSPTEDFSKKLKYEQHYGQIKPKNPETPRTDIQKPAAGVTRNLSERLLQVLNEEEDLRKSVQGDTDTPVIRQNYFKEIYESRRGQTLKMYGAELSSDDHELIKNSDDQQQAEDDEVAFINEQRVSSKSSNPQSIQKNSNSSGNSNNSGEKPKAPPRI